MHATRRELISQRWNIVQYELIPELARDVGTLTPKLERVIHAMLWFHLHKKLPSASTFSRAFDEFAQSALPERAHEALIKEHLGEVMDAGYT
jgi:hypothetical protein